MIDTQKFYNLAVGTLALASIVPVFWAFHEYVYTRDLATRMNTSHRIETIQLTENTIWVRVDSFFENVGNTKIEISRLLVTIQQIKPLESQIEADLMNNPQIFENHNIILWPTIAERWIEVDFILEPGEEDFSPAEFILPSSLSAIKIYTFVPSGSDESDHGWPAATIIELN